MASTSGMPAVPSQPAVSRAQALQRIGGWLTSTATTAGEYNNSKGSFAVAPRADVHPGTRVMCEHCDDNLTACCDAAGERLGVAAARGATAIQRLTGAEKYQVYRCSLVEQHREFACSMITESMHGGARSASSYCSPFSPPPQDYHEALMRLERSAGELRGEARVAALRRWVGVSTLGFWAP